MGSRPRSRGRLLLALVTAVSAGLFFLGTPQPHAAANCDGVLGAPGLPATHPPYFASLCPQPALQANPSAPSTPDVTQTNLATALAIALAGGSSAGGSLSNTSSALPASLSLRLALPAALASSARPIWPVTGPITQPFGVPELGVGPPHTGIDIGQNAGSPVRAALAGRVIFAGGDPCCGLGYWIEIDHGNRLATVYGHFMRPPLLLVGDYVKQGQTVGFSGSTGFSTGPHLHFEVRLDGTPVDPLRVLPSR